MANDIRFELRLRLDALVDLDRRLHPGSNVSRASVIRTMINELWESAPLTTAERMASVSAKRKAVVKVHRSYSWDVLDKDDFRTASFETRAIAREYASIWSRDFPDEAPFRVKRSK